MRAADSLTPDPAVSAEQPWLPGAPHAVAALTTWAVFGASACATGLLLATLASFAIYLPVTALALNGGQAIATGDPAPAITPSARAVLLGLWTATAWAGAALASMTG